MLNNSTIAATDVVVVAIADFAGSTDGAYQCTVSSVESGACMISLRNMVGGSLSEAVKINFAVIRAATS
jgi:hypothetical protein